MLLSKLIIPISTAIGKEPVPEPPSSEFAFESKEPHKVQIITSGPMALKTYLEQIESAQSSIDLESYILKNDTTGRLILNSLINKSKSGTKVRVLLDAYGSNIFNDALLFHFKEAGVELKYYRPSFNNTFSIPTPLDHRKLLVIDNKRVMAG